MVKTKVTIPALAISELSMALKMNPQDVNAFKNRAFAWLKIGKYDRAITDLAGF